MNVATLQISPILAAQKLEQYKAMPISKRTEEDELLIKTYKQAIKGLRLLDVEKAFLQTGLDDKGRPLLGLARANWSVVYCHPRPWCNKPYPHHLSYSPGFSMIQRGSDCAGYNTLYLRDNLFNMDDTKGSYFQSGVRSQVPYIPPDIRPDKPHLYTILFEATWEEYPVDPFLMRHVYGSLYAIEAEWELTALEQSLLSMIHAGDETT
jgi:hypothetical protein